MKRAMIMITGALIALAACNGGDDSARVHELEQEVRQLRTEVSTLTASTTTASTTIATTTTARPTTTAMTTTAMTTTTSSTTTSAPTTTTTVVLDERTLDWFREHDALDIRLTCVLGADGARSTFLFEVDPATFEWACAGNEIPPATTTLPPANALTPEEIGAALAGPATEWLMTPSGPAFDAIAAAAQGLLGSGRPIPALPDGSHDSEDVRGRLETLAEYPGDDYYVVVAIEILAPFLPGLPAIVEGGSLTVGQDIEPGRYRTISRVENCYWETLDEAGEINDNNFVNAAPQVIMTVRSSDFAVNSSGCAPWIRIG